MRSLNLDYYYGNESEQFSFFRIPKVLFTDERFKKLSAESKVLYGMLLDRMGLSRVNGWLDKENRVYIVFTLEEIQDNMNCSKQKAVNMMAELDDKKGIGLIEKKRQGLGKPNIIYVKNFILERAEPVGNTGDFKKSKNHTSGGMKNGLQEVPKLDCNNTDYNNTDFSHIESSHIHQNDGADGGNDVMKTRDQYEKIIKDNIEYEMIHQNWVTGKGDVDNLVDIMVDICSMPDESTIKVNGVALPVGVVKGRFMEINSMYVEYIMESLKETPSNVRNIRAYLITTVFNAPATMSQYYRSKVNHDFHSGAFVKGG